MDTRYFYFRGKHCQINLIFVKESKSFELEKNTHQIIIWYRLLVHRFLPTKNRYLKPLFNHQAHKIVYNIDDKKRFIYITILEILIFVVFCIAMNLFKSSKNS